MRYKIESNFSPAGDQPKTIDLLVKNINQSKKDHLLIGATGTGKTFTIANIIAKFQKPSLILTHNKTLVAQLYEEMKSFFPDNAVEYFISYYDYYQPEAYIPKTNTFIAKDALINKKIDKMRHSATRSLLERSDVIVVASVSCIYGIGAPETYLQSTIRLFVEDYCSQVNFIKNLLDIQYKNVQNQKELKRGCFITSNGVLELIPSHSDDIIWKIIFKNEVIKNIVEVNCIDKAFVEIQSVVIFANNHYVVPRPRLNKAIVNIEKELQQRLEYFNLNKQHIEAERLKQRVNFDLEMLRKTSGCKGIENYSLHLTGKKTGEPPDTLFSYLPKDGMLFIDESHVTIPQIKAMYNADRARKNVLVEHGFRLQSALDNRPLKFLEWEELKPCTVYISATPAQYEVNCSSDRVAEQIIRPTGLLDPVCIVRPSINQVDDLIKECKKAPAENIRVLVIVLTKIMAEHLVDYMRDINIKTTFLHSGIVALKRIEILNDLRRGVYDVIVGVNLLREGLDIPECGLVAILDADKEGFLRSQTSLIQSIGRAARNIKGRAILYADVMTKAMSAAIDETNRRRLKQMEHNKKYNIEPKQIFKNIYSTLEKISKDSDTKKDKYINFRNMSSGQTKKLYNEMLEAAKILDFEKAAYIKQLIYNIEKI